MAAWFAHETADMGCRTPVPFRRKHEPQAPCPYAPSWPSPRSSLGAAGPALAQSAALPALPRRTRIARPRRRTRGLRRGRAAARRDRPAYRLLPLDRLRARALRDSCQRPGAGRVRAMRQRIQPARGELLQPSPPSSGDAGDSRAPPELTGRGRADLAPASRRNRRPRRPAQLLRVPLRRPHAERPVPPQPDPGQCLTAPAQGRATSSRASKASPARRRTARLRAHLRRLLLPARQAPRPADARTPTRCARPSARARRRQPSRCRERRRPAAGRSR